jgi:hypothetical protein
MVGTAFPAPRLLLVEQPGPWGEEGLLASRLDHRVGRALLARAARAGLRVQAIRCPGRFRGGSRRWMVVDTRDGVQSVRGGEFSTDADLLAIDLESSGAPVPDVPLFLVCAHGKHDPCCALRGRTVARALHDVAPGRVWETTHLGGDRFAANVLVLPGGLLYGRVLPFAAAEFVAAADRDEVIGALLRGRVGVPPAGQAALAFAYEHLAVRDRAAVRVTSVSRAVLDPDGRSVVDVAISGPHGSYRCTVAVEQVGATGLTCHNPEPNNFLRHRVLTVDSMG